MRSGQQTPSTLDVSVLERLEEELGGIDELVQIYLDALPVRCASIVQAVADGDARALRHAVHTLRSASAFLGATRLVALCDRIGSRGRPVPAALGREVMRESRRLERELRGILASGPPVAE